MHDRSRPHIGDNLGQSLEAIAGQEAHITHPTIAQVGEGEFNRSLQHLWFRLVSEVTVAQVGRPGFSVQQKRMLWERQKKGESIYEIARVLGKSPSSIHWVFRDKPLSRT